MIAAKTLPLLCGVAISIVVAACMLMHQPEVVATYSAASPPRYTSPLTGGDSKFNDAGHHTGMRVRHSLLQPMSIKGAAVDLQVEVCPWTARPYPRICQEETRQPWYMAECMRTLNTLVREGKALYFLQGGQLLASISGGGCTHLDDDLDIAIATSLKRTDGLPINQTTYQASSQPQP